MEIKYDENYFSKMANCIRSLSIDAIESACSGHPGMPMGMADAATILFHNHLKFDASNPQWPDRDRFILSNGHGSMLLYSLLYLCGYPDMTLDQLKNFRQWGSLTPGHPEYGHTSGVEVTTGPLGQGLASAVGMAIAEKRLSDEFHSKICNHFTYVFAGDGCLMEGIGQEAISLAGHLKLSKLVVLYDNNSITIDGNTNLSFSEDIPSRFRSCGWNVISIDGHNYNEIDSALYNHRENHDKPTLISMKTIIGFGSPNKQGTKEIHGAPLGFNEVKETKKNLNFDTKPFEIPQELLLLWRKVGQKGHQKRLQWENNFTTIEDRDEFYRRINGTLPTIFKKEIKDAIKEYIIAPKNISTRQSNHIALNTLTKIIPEMIGGSADLTSSNLTRTSSLQDNFQANSSGRYICYGVREFAMSAIMNGLCVHGGFIPFGGTFLVFSDYARNAIRLSAMMGIRVIFIMTHDSIGLGEDGPTHQPIEHLASLRAIPNLNVFRPCDIIETLECWEYALQSYNTPSLFALSRQNVPQIRIKDTHHNLSSKGAYIIAHFNKEKKIDLTIIATGTEVSIAIEAGKDLAKEGFSISIVSMPSWELFDMQDINWRKKTIGQAPCIAIEAAGKFGWSRYVGSEDNIIGMNGFGASARADILYNKFGINKDNIIKRAYQLLN